MVNCDSSQVNNLTRKSFAEYWFNASLKQQNISNSHYPCSISLYLGQFIYSPLSKEQAHISTWIVCLCCTVFNTMTKLIFRIILLLWKILVCRNFTILELKLQKFNQDTLIFIFTLWKSITAKKDFHCFKGLQTAFQLHCRVSKRALKMPKIWYKIALILNYGLRCYIQDKDYKGSAVWGGRKGKKKNWGFGFCFFLLKKWVKESKTVHFITQSNIWCCEDYFS